MTNLSNSKSAKGSRKREAYLNQQRDGNDNGEQHADKKQRVDDGKPKDIRIKLCHFGICHMTIN